MEQSQEDESNQHDKLPRAATDSQGRGSWDAVVVAAMAYAATVFIACCLLPRSAAPSGRLFTSTRGHEAEILAVSVAAVLSLVLGLVSVVVAARTRKVPVALPFALVCVPWLTGVSAASLTYGRALVQLEEASVELARLHGMGVLEEVLPLQALGAWASAILILALAMGWGAIALSSRGPGAFAWRSGLAAMCLVLGGGWLALESQRLAHLLTVFQTWGTHPQEGYVPEVLSNAISTEVLMLATERAGFAVIGLTVLFSLASWTMTRPRVSIIVSALVCLIMGASGFVTNRLVLERALTYQERKTVMLWELNDAEPARAHGGESAIPNLLLTRTHLISADEGSTPVPLDDEAQLGRRLARPEEREWNEDNTRRDIDELSRPSPSFVALSRDTHGGHLAKLVAAARQQRVDLNICGHWSEDLTSAERAGAPEWVRPLLAQSKCLGLGTYLPRAPDVRFRRARIGEVEFAQRGRQRLIVALDDRSSADEILRFWADAERSESAISIDLEPTE